MHATEEPVRPAFGAMLVDYMAMAAYRDGTWDPFDIRPTEAIPIHPGAHVLHYAISEFLEWMEKAPSGYGWPGLAAAGMKG